MLVAKTVSFLAGLSGFTVSYIYTTFLFIVYSLACLPSVLDTVGWVAGRASGL